MSHNVTVEGVIFDDIEMLNKAFDELVRDNLVHGATFSRDPIQMRGWSGRKETVDCGILMPNERYDVGFRKTPEGLVPYFEHGFQPQGIAAEPGAEDINGQVCRPYDGAATVGRLAQRYRLLQLERNAHRNGMMTRRVTRQKGQIELAVTHR